jgi:rSAM/selenodomain-associated transferase 1
VQLAERTLATAVAARDAGIVDRIELWCAPDAERPLFTEWRDRYRVELATQHGEDLGTRMRYALESALARGVPALLIGTDCPALDIGTLACARAELAHHDAVFVPAEDGGYVLIGLVRPVDAFSGIEWSVPGVMAATRLKLAAQHATWRELPPLWDVDVAEDLARWEALDRHDCTDERRAFALRSPGSTLTAGYDPDDPVGIRRGRHPPSRCSP